MDHYKIILDQGAFDAFIAGLPKLEDDEVWYACLFGRNKYDPDFPKSKDSGQLVRFTAEDASELKDKVRRLECPVGSYVRDGIVASQQCLALYLALNPRSKKDANCRLAKAMVDRLVDGHMSFNPVSLAHTCIHNAVSRKFVVDFDFDGVDPAEHLPAINELFPTAPDAYRILKTRGGFHLLVDLEAIRHMAIATASNRHWHQYLSKLPGCDVRGTDTLTPVPGCTQGGFCPYFLEISQEAMRGT